MLHESDFLPPLCAEDELVHFRRLVQLRGMVRHYRAQGRERKAAVVEKEWEELRNFLTRSNIALVLLITKRYSHCGDSEELVSQGLFALIRCVDKFNPELGWKFSTYAGRAIVNGIIRHVDVEVRWGKRYGKPIGDDARGLGVSEEPIGEDMGRLFFENLDEVEEQAVRLRYGLTPGTSGRVATFDQISEATGVKRHAIGALLAGALAKLKEGMNE
jgi:RNA polymerase primary sigma factor